MLPLRLVGSKPRSCAYPKELKTLGDHIRKRRLDLGLLQRDVAERVGAAVASLWVWENECREPELKFMPAIIAFLGDDPRPDAEMLGERLVRYRVGKGWSQKRLAEALRVDPTTLSRWERKEKSPWGVYAERVAKLLANGQPESS